MQIYKVTHADKSKSGKDRVYLDGKHNWQDAFYLSAKCPMPPLGSKVEANTHSWRADNAKQDTWFLDDWKLCADQPPIAEVKATVAASTSVAESRDELAKLDLTMKLVSNVLGSALSALRLQKPEEIASWAKAALEAAQGVIRGGFDSKPAKAKPEFDDKVPY